MSELEPTPAPAPGNGASSVAPNADTTVSTSAIGTTASGAKRFFFPSSFVLRPSSLPGLALEVFLILLIVIGIFFRFNWSNWSQGTDLHPDEYGLTSTLTQLHIPDTLGDYFNTRLSPLSPYLKYDVDGNPLAPSAENPAPDNGLPWGQLPLTIIRFHRRSHQPDRLR